MSIKRPLGQIRVESAFAVQVRPLGEAELVIMQIAMGDFAPDWSVELHGICADEATLILLPADGDDENGPSFIISRETCGLHVEQIHWDAVTEVGVFASLHEVLEALRMQLAFSANLTPPDSATLH